MVCKISWAIVPLIVCLSLLFLVGCEKQSPLAPIETPQKTVSKNSQLRILELGDLGRSLSKTTSVSQYVTKWYGGILFLEHFSDDSSFHMNTSLEILPGTISRNTTVSLTVDDEHFCGSMDVVFNPHGIVFSEPAILNIYASGVDLSGFNPDSIDIYYDNPLTGEWERMERDAIYVYYYYPHYGTGSWSNGGTNSSTRGIVHVINARIPHFSRYAVGDAGK